MNEENNDLSFKQYNAVFGNPVNNDVILGVIRLALFWGLKKVHIFGSTLFDFAILSWYRWSPLKYPPLQCITTLLTLNVQCETMEVGALYNSTATNDIKLWLIFQLDQMIGPWYPLARSTVTPLSYSEYSDIQFEFARMFVW